MDFIYSFLIFLVKRLSRNRKSPNVIVLCSKGRSFFFLIQCSSLNKLYRLHIFYKIKFNLVEIKEKP